MKRSILALFLLGVAGSVAAAQTLYISPDVPTDPDVGFQHPWDIVRCDPSSPVPYVTMWIVPGDPAVGALHKMDRPGSWLFSVEAPHDLAGALGGANAEPRDVIRLDTLANYSFFFDGSCVLGPVPLESNVDALYLDGGDNADLVVSFDVPTTILGTDFMPSELVRYTRTGVGIGPCDWMLAGSVIDFRTVSAVYHPSFSNVTGADRFGNGWIVTFDIPADLLPSAPYPGPTYEPGHVAGYDQPTATWDLYKNLQLVGANGWPLDCYVDALSCGANPGRVYDRIVFPFLIDLGKSAIVAGDIYINWSGSCADADDHGIYEGDIGTWYSHVKKLCTDAAPYFTEDFTPQATSSYYLVVPIGCMDEGSYGLRSNSVERPQPPLTSDRCVTAQNLTPCP